MACNLALIGHFLIIWIYYLGLPTMVFETLLFTITLQVTSWYFLHFLEDSGMLVWYSMLNTIPETAQASHSRKCSNNTEYGKVHLIWPDRYLTPLKQFV